MKAEILEVLRFRSDVVSGEEAVALPGGFSAPRSQVDTVKSELERLRVALANLSGAAGSGRAAPRRWSA